MVHGLKFSVSSIGHCINDAHHAALLPALLAAMPSTLSSGHVLPPGSSSSTPSKTAHMKMYGVRTSKASVGLKVSAGAGRRAARGSVVVQAKVVPRADGKRIVSGKCFVCKDNIDTDQIIPAEYLTLVPSKPDEYEKLGSYAMIGLPDDLYPTRYVKEGAMKTEYPVVIAGSNFGCGSSREHAPISMGASGTQCVVAESYARIFFRNCVSTGELYPVEATQRICDEIETGMEVEVDMVSNVLTVKDTGKTYKLNDLGDAGPVIDAGGLFDYARKTGMIKTA